MRRTLALAVVGVVISTMALAAELKVAISFPADESKVAQRPIVKGLISDPKATVWVVVHPLEGGNYWVQPRINVRDSGKWTVQIHIGRPGPKDVGKYFEVRAVGNPGATLREGKVLDDWPAAAAISNTVELIRK